MSEMSFISLRDVLSMPELDLGFILQIISTISSRVVRVKINSTSHGLPKYVSYDLLLVTSIFPARRGPICVKYSLNLLAIKSLSEHILLSTRNTVGNLSCPLPWFKTFFYGRPCFLNVIPMLIKYIIAVCLFSCAYTLFGLLIPQTLMYYRKLV